MTDVLTRPIGVIGWDLSDDEWRAARSAGFGGSDIAAILGFSTYRSPWDVWAEKTGVRHWDDQGSSEAADLGVALEPWLLDQARMLLGVPVEKPQWRTYAHPAAGWKRCSPDGVLADGRIVEAKTAGLASFRAPAGWDDGGTPLGYEFQCRWSMHVMDAPAVELIGLVAGKGLVQRRILRDPAIEADMVAQVSDWYQRHIVGGYEPPLGAVDNEAMARLFPRANGEAVDLDTTDAPELIAAYVAAREAESAAKTRKEAAGAALKKLLGHNQIGLLNDRTAVAWSDKKGSVDWPRLVAELAEKSGVEAPNPEGYRKPSTRSLNVKDV